MANYIEIGDEIAFHPGYYIQEYLDYKDIPVERFAAELGIDEDDLRAILNGEMNLTQSLAEDLLEVTGVSTCFWLALQNKFNEMTADKRNNSNLHYNSIKVKEKILCQHP